MIYSFPQLYKATSRFQTYNIVRFILEKNGHTIVEDMDNCDAVLVSICDVTEIPMLVCIKKQSKKPVICGGPHALNYYSVKLHSDMVWLGHIWDFAELRLLGDISNSCYCYTGTEKKLKTSMHIEWEDIPITQISPHKTYYLGGVGCKRKCQFCFTSWTNPHQVNDTKNIDAAIGICANRGVHLMVTSNEYDYDVNVKTKDMILTDYIKTNVRGTFLRSAVEFATDETRRMYGKPITKNDIYHALQKMKLDNITMKLFHITGLDALSDWERYIDDMCFMLDKVKNKRLLHLEFNNLQYQNFTPLYSERKNIDPDKYIDISVTKRWYDKLRRYSRAILLGAPSPFVHVAARMGIELAREKEQSEYWLGVMRNRHKHTTDSAYNALFTTGIFDTPHLFLNHKTGEIVSRSNTTGKQP